MFSSEFSEIFKNHCFAEHLWTAASEGIYPENFFVEFEHEKQSLWLCYHQIIKIFEFSLLQLNNLKTKQPSP